MIPEEIGERIEKIQVNNYSDPGLVLSPGLEICTKCFPLTSC